VRYDFTTDLAAFNPPRLVDQHLLVSLHGRQAEIDRFLGVFAGVTPISSTAHRATPCDYSAPAAWQRSPPRTVLRPAP